MNKTTRLFVRISDEEKAAAEKAAGSKGLSFFILRCVRLAIKYRRLIEQAELLNKNYAPAKLEVRVK
jgi:hypothetical protein